MKNDYIKKNLLYTFYIITLLFLFLILYSKTTDTNSVNLNYFRKLQKNPKYGDYENILFKCEVLREKNKNLENNITLLMKKIQDYNLKIKVNQIYIKMLYILISILLLTIIIIIIVKFCLQCRKRPKNILKYNIKEKNDKDDIDFLERKNEIHN